MLSRLQAKVYINGRFARSEEFPWEGDLLDYALKNNYEYEEDSQTVIRHRGSYDNGNVKTITRVSYAPDASAAVG